MSDMLGVKQVHRVISQTSDTVRAKQLYSFTPQLPRAHTHFVKTRDPRTSARYART